MSLSAQNAGFTLIELMIVLSIVAIFVVVGVPNFQNLIKDNRLSTQANSLVSSIQLARSEALKLRAPVSICRTTDGTSCVGNGGAWDSGWLVFVDDNQNGAADATDGNGDTDAGERILLAQGALSSSNTLRGVAAVNNFVSYLPTGLSSSNGNFRLCDGNDPDVNKGRQITISTTGRVQSRKATSALPLATCP